MWVMFLEYSTYNGGTAEHYMPIFNTSQECLWWLEHLWSILKQNGAHDATKAICEFRASASLS